MKPASRIPRGFSLIELLIVVAIIGILASLLVPAVSRGKQIAQKTVCLSNLKQIQLAYILYSDENSGRLVVNGMGEVSSPFLANWVLGLMGHQDTSDAANRQSTNTSYLVGRLALFSPYVTEAKLYRCPSDRATVPINGRRCARTRSYSMDQFLGLYLNRTLPPDSTGGQWVDSPDLYTRFGQRFYDLQSDLAPRNPENIWVMIDDQEDSIFTPEFRGGYDLHESDWIGGIPASRHNTSGTLSFADGHVEAKSWRDPSTTRTPTGYLEFNYPPRSERNLDKIWLDQRYPAPYSGN
jgi:prepilin-type N-terminal cleavage/methylation domain-containing protein/prepilin-type processing-associated H-X9-DG protein